MANKQIIDYAAGVFSTSDVFLKQPTAGGIYKKVSLAAILGFKMAFGYVSQVGAGAPTITELYNGIGGAITGARSSAGNYELQGTGLFTLNKTLIVPFDTIGFTSMPLTVSGFASHIYTYYLVDANACALFTGLQDGTGVDISAIDASLQIPYLILVAN